MRKVIKFTVLLFMLLLVNCVSWWVLTANQEAGTYPFDADSIGLPITATFCFSILALPVIFLVSIFSIKNVFAWSKLKNIIIKVLARLGFSLLYLIAFLFAFLGFLSWSFENHWLIALSYTPLFLVLMAYIILEVSEYKSN